MKRRSTLLTAIIATVCMMLLSGNVMGQDEDVTDKDPLVSVGLDLYNRYVWRGTDFGASPSFQPGIEFSKFGIAIGAWGAYPFIANDKSSFDYEADLYLSYTYNDMVTALFTDYFIPLDGGTSYSYFDYEALNDSIGTSHGFEATLTFNGLKDLPLSITVSKFVGGFDNKSFYAELGYSFGDFDVFVGAGNEVYTVEDGFNVVNAGIAASKELKMSDEYSLPVSGSLVINPDAKMIFMVFGLSF